MRILAISYEYPPLGGGGGVAVAHYARAWARRGHHVSVLTSAGPGLLAQEDDQGVLIYRVFVPGRQQRATASLRSLVSFPPAAVRFALRHWRATDFDLLNSFFAIPSGPAGAVLARRWRLPHVVSIMGGDIYDPSKRLSPHRTPGLKQMVLRVLTSASQVISDSRDMAERAVALYGLRRRPTVLPLGLRLPFATGRPAASRPVTIISVARLVKRKLFHQLLEAFARLPRGLARLVIIGDGPLREALERQIAELGIQQEVELTGFISEEEKYRRLYDADIFVLASEHEGFGLVYLEAASQGLPIVAATVGGQLDFLEHGRTGWLVPPGDVAALRGALATLVTQPALRQWMGQQALAVARRYDIEQVADRYLEILHDSTNAAA